MTFGYLLNTRTGEEYRAAWDLLQREAVQCSTYLGKELEGSLAKGPDIAGELEEGQSSRQLITEQREQLREAVLREALLRHPDQTARPAIAYPQLDKLTTAWKLSLPGPTTGSDYLNIIIRVPDMGGNGVGKQLSPRKKQNIARIAKSCPEHIPRLSIC